MALSEIAPLTDTPGTVFAKINAAIDAVVALQAASAAEPTRAEQAEQDLAGRIASEVSRAEQAEQGLSTAINLRALASDLAALARALGAKAAASDVAALATAVGTKAAASDVATLSSTVAGKASASDLAAEIARAKAAEALLYFSARPGDSPARFSSQTIGRTPAADASGLMQQSPLGLAYVLPAGATLASRDPVWLEPEAFFALRVVYQRLSDPSPPGNAPLLVAVQWLDASWAGLSFDTIRAVPLAVADGLQVATNRIPSAPLDIAALVPPAGARFFRPFVRDLSRDGTTLVHSMRISDVTNAGVYAPDVSRFAARLVALESRLSQFGG